MNDNSKTYFYFKNRQWRTILFSKNIKSKTGTNANAKNNNNCFYIVKCFLIHRRRVPNFIQQNRITVIIKTVFFFKFLPPFLKSQEVQHIRPYNFFFLKMGLRIVPLNISISLRNTLYNKISNTTAHGYSKVKNLILFRNLDREEGMVTLYRVSFLSYFLKSQLGIFKNI